MKVLILSCSTGQGHNSAGQAVYECLQQRGVCCEMRDALGFSSGRVSKNVCGAYVGITRQVVQSVAAFCKGEDFNVVV